MDSLPPTRKISQRVAVDFRKSGVPLNGLATKSGIPRTTLRRKLDGHAEFSISELLCIAPHINGNIREWLEGVAA